MELATTLQGPINSKSHSSRRRQSQLLAKLLAAKVNPAMIALQQVIIGQYEKFMQQSRQLSNRTNGGDKASFSLAEMVTSE